MGERALRVSIHSSGSREDETVRSNLYPSKPDLRVEPSGCGVLQMLGRHPFLVPVKCPRIREPTVSHSEEGAKKGEALAPGAGGEPQGEIIHQGSLEGRGGATARGEEKEKKEETFGEGRERRKEGRRGTRQGARGPGRGARLPGRACGAGPGGRAAAPEPGGAAGIPAPRSRSPLPCCCVRPGCPPRGMCAPRCRAPGAPSFSGACYACGPSPGPAPGSGCARGAPPSWGCSLWSSARSSYPRQPVVPGEDPCPRSGAGEDQQVHQRAHQGRQEPHRRDQK